MNIKNIFKSKDTVKLTCYTSSVATYKHASIAKTREYIPSWYRSIPSDAGKLGLLSKRNMRLCAGFNDLFQSGFVIPLWSDIRISTGKKGTLEYDWQFSDMVSHAEIHPPEQRGSYLPEDKYAHIKMVTPWKFHCDEDIKFTFMQNHWVFDSPENVIIPSAVIDFKYQHAANVNMIIPRKDDDFTFDIPFGTPVAQLIPMTDKKVELDLRLVTPDEFNGIETASANTTFRGTYYSKKKNKRQNGCPLHVERD